MAPAGVDGNLGKTKCLVCMCVGGGGCKTAHLTLVSG